MLGSFIITFHSARLDNLLQTLRFLERNHSLTAHCQLVLVCQDKCEPLETFFARYDHFNLETEQMNLPKLTNFGVQQTISEKIVVLESDRILPYNYFTDIFEQLKPGLQITTKKMLKLTAPASDEQINNNDFSYKEEIRSEESQIGMRNVWSGNTAFMKADFIKAGQMDEEYKGYGWADNDMTERMSEIVCSIFRPEIELHLWHPPLTYGDGDQKRMFLENGLKFCRKWNKPLPNWFRMELKENRTAQWI